MNLSGPHTYSKPYLLSHNIPIGISTGSSDYAFEMKSNHLKPFFSNFEFILKCGSDPEVKNGKPAADAFSVARTRFDPVPEGKILFCKSCDHSDS